MSLMQIRGYLLTHTLRCFAYSLNRKLRYNYDGEYFRFRQASGSEADYPTSTPNLSEDVFLVKLYDQKAKAWIVRL